MAARAAFLVLALAASFGALDAAASAAGVAAGASSSSGAGAAGSWSTDFTSDDGSFLVDDGAVSHCPECIYESASHVSFGAGGVQLRLDDAPCAATPRACCAGGLCAHVAAGHMRSAAAQAFGSFTFVARPAFAPPAAAGAVPANSFACLTTSYLGSPHHEVATCFLGSAPGEVSLGYWSPGTSADGVVKRVDTGLPLHDAFHVYDVRWTPTTLALAIDGVVIINATAAAANTTIPWLPGQVLLINRMQSATYAGPAIVALQHASYAPMAA